MTSAEMRFPAPRHFVRGVPPSSFHRSGVSIPQAPLTARERCLFLDRMVGVADKNHFLIPDHRRLLAPVAGGQDRGTKRVIRSPS